MSTDPVSDPPALVALNVALLQQALDLVHAHLGPEAPRYDGRVGPHLRHVIEHHEALLFAAPGAVVDYDARPRDAALESDPTEARRRLQRLQATLRHDVADRLADPVRVRGLADLSGDRGFEVASSVGRELAYVASHAVHHHALLHDHCVRHGIPVPDGFGVAPATRAHARAACAAA